MQCVVYKASTEKETSEMNQKQTYFTDKTMPVLLAFISAFPPLSTDMYLPALPQMVTVFETSPSQINLTLSLFFAFFAAGLLIWGPLSEKYGRKPILSAGLVIYIISSFLCAVSGSITELIVFRVFQAIGGAAATAVATAMVKDLYDGKKREHVLAAVMAMVIIAPVLAPMIGAFVLKFTSWRAVFWILAGIGGLALAAGSLLDETLSHQYQGSAFRSMGRLGVVMKNPGFSSLIGIFSMAPVSMMGFIAASSYIYIQKFGLSEQAYSFYFALNAVSAMMGPLLYMRISRYFSPHAIISTCFPLLGLSGLLVITLGQLSPWIFALTMMPATMSITLMRPPSANLMLEQQQKDTGSASSLINFFGMFMGSMGVFIISLGGNDLIWILGIMQMTIGLFGGGLWFSVKNKPFIIQGSSNRL